METLRFFTDRLRPFFYFYIVLETILRLLLLAFGWDGLDTFRSLPATFLAGFFYDIAVFVYFAIPILAVAMLSRRRYRKASLDIWVSTIGFFIFAYALVFSAVGEWLFWDEFQTRYNFIAVDYLVYTKEVIGNIRESYPLCLLLTIIAVVSAGATAVYHRHISRSDALEVPLRTRCSALALACLLSTMSFVFVNSYYADLIPDQRLSHIARNGIFELFSAFRNNELDYERFYSTRPDAEIADFIRDEVGGTSGLSNPLVRTIKRGEAKKYNLVIITVESLGANFLKEFGGRTDITPHLDALTDKSLFFSNLYATGTRTVYGLSALSLSMPPVPGNSIVRRPDNDNLYTIGHVLKSQGYATKFIYGGYGYFDNMNKFFGDNDYQIIDRSSFSDDEIGFANIWGIADDDVYRRSIKENDRSHAAGEPFFDMIMTTSNHRPYTFPDGKIDLPSKTSGRAGGVKFTDFAIGEFLAEAQKRPWFNDTIFVIIADHTAGSAGRQDLDPAKYHIPAWIYAPKIVTPGRIDTLASQIDIIPTILGLMGKSYDSKFYGKDLRRENPDRAFISNYQSLGLLTPDSLTILKPGKKSEYWAADEDGKMMRQDDVPKPALDRAIGYYQAAAQWKRWSRQQN